MRAYREVYGELPLRVKFIVEGEEEIGSPNLARFADAHQDLVRAAACVWEGGYKDSSGRPVIYCGVKGICYVDLRAGGAPSDLHSMWGAIVPNPLWRLTWALGQLKSSDERIAIPGFYDAVRRPTPEDHQVLASIPFDAGERAAEFGLTTTTSRRSRASACSWPSTAGGPETAPKGLRQATLPIIP